MITTVTLGRLHNIAFPFPRTSRTVAHSITQSLRTTCRCESQIIMAITLIEPRSLLIVGDVRQFCYTTCQRCHIFAQLCPESMRITPIHICLTIIIGINRGIYIKPVILIPYQRFAQRIFERTIRRIGLKHADSMSVKRSIEIILAIALYILNSPSSILTTAPREVL